MVSPEATCKYGGIEGDFSSCPKLILFTLA